MRLGAALLTIAMTACTTPTAGAGTDLPIPERGTGKGCDAGKAQGLIGRAASDALGAEAMRLSGAGVLRWIPPGAMVTMDYRSDRLNIHLGAKNEILTIACG